jgi:transcription termination/antitermination protein NusG
MVTHQSQHRWYALWVKSNREKLIAAALQQKGYEQFLPLYRTERSWSDRLKDLELPLFSEYVFCRLDPLHRLPVLTIPGAISFVGIGNNPTPIEDSEITALQTIVRAGVPVVPWPFLQVGERVRIERGPLREIEGVVTELKNGLRLVVSVGLLQRSVAVEIDRDSITPVPRPMKPAQASAASGRNSKTFKSA